MPHRNLVKLIALACFPAIWINSPVNLLKFRSESGFNRAVFSRMIFSFLQNEQCPQSSFSRVSPKYPASWRLRHERLSKKSTIWWILLMPWDSFCINSECIFSVTASISNAWVMMSYTSTAWRVWSSIKPFSLKYSRAVMILCRSVA